MGAYSFAYHTPTYPRTDDTDSDDICPGAHPSANHACAESVCLCHTCAVRMLRVTITSHRLQHDASYTRMRERPIKAATMQREVVTQ